MVMDSDCPSEARPGLLRAPADEPARAVTAGRCVGANDPGEVMSDVSVPGATVTFQVFAPLTGTVAPASVEVPVDSVEWAGTRGADRALLRLGVSYAELAERGVEPVRAVDAASAGTQALVAGVPVGGLAAAQPYLRGSRCQVGETTRVLQNEWLWHDMQAVPCTGVLEGSRGSVVLSEAGDAVGMVTTTTIAAPAGADCTLLRPCEVAGDGGLSVASSTSYVAPVGDIASCYVDGELRLAAPCALEPPGAVVPARAQSPAARPGEVIRVRVRDVSPRDEIRVKQGPLGSVDCGSSGRWRQGSVDRARDDEQPSAADTWVHKITLPEEEGRMLVCVGSQEHPTEIVLAADASAPDPGWIEVATTPVTGGVLVEPITDPPEIVRLRWVSGPSASIRCDGAEGYVEYPGTPAMIQAADLPSTVCVVAIDAAGNVSSPAARTIE